MWVANSLPLTGQQLDVFLRRISPPHSCLEHELGDGRGSRKNSVHCQAEIALETGAWECARWDLQAEPCKVKKEVILYSVGKATEDILGVQCGLLSSELIHTTWKRKRKLQ